METAYRFVLQVARLCGQDEISEKLYRHLASRNKKCVKKNVSKMKIKIRAKLMCPKQKLCNI